MNKNVFLVGLNHDTAPLELRERVAFDISALSSSCQELRTMPGVDEALILSTCNRTEIYGVCVNPNVISRWIAEAKNIPLEILREHIYIRSSRDVLTHAARVASGIDSMVLGETQISGQMKAAYKYSHASGSLGKALHKVFESAFSVAKEVRSNTEIGAHSVSLASASLRALERIFPNSDERSVLFIGAGEMIRFFCDHFSARKFARRTFINRTAERALRLACQYGGDHIDLRDLADNLWLFDIIVSCTGSPIPVLGKGAFEESLKRRRHNPMVVFDLAVPRDIEPSTSALEDVFLFTVDDLGSLVQRGKNIRQAAIDNANTIIEKRVLEIFERMSTDYPVNVIKSFRKLGADIVRRELEKSMAALELSEDAGEVLSSLSNALEKKFLDRPSRVLNNAKGEERRDLSEALLKLFELDKPV